MSGHAKLTERQQSRLAFALEILERHSAAVERAIVALREVTDGAEYADWARQAAAALREELGDSERDFIRERLGLNVQAPEPSPTAKAAVEES